MVVPALITGGAMVAGGLAKNRSDKKIAEEAARVAQAKMEAEAEQERKRLEQERLMKLFDQKMATEDEYSSKQQGAFEQLMNSYTSILS